MVTAVHNFDFRLNEKKKMRHVVIKTHVFDRICTLSHTPTIFESVKKLYPLCAGQMLCLEEGQYLVTNDSVLGARVSVTQRKDRKDNKTADRRKRGGERLFT